MALTKVSRGLLTTSIVDNGNATAITIDSSENVGIGTSSPSSSGGKLAVKTANAGYVVIEPTSSVTNQIATGIRLHGNANETDRYAGIFCYNGAANNVNSMTFWTSSSGSSAERMRIDSSGNLLVGTTTVAPNSTTTIKGSLGLVGPSGVSTSSITFNNPSNVKYWGIATDQSNFYITDADFTHYCFVGQSMTSWTFGSDRRLKENIVDVPYGLNAVMAMQPRAFKFKSSGVETIGFVAQELQEVVPEAVSGTEVEYSDTDTPQEKANKSLGVSQDTLIPVLVKAMQEQQATIESQASAITDLTTRLTALENN